MGRKFDKHSILREKDPWAVARNVFDVALEFALLGYVDIATKLFVLFEEFSKGCKSSWSPGMIFAWEATGSFPDFVTPEERTPEAIFELETERILWLREKNASKEGLDQLVTRATEGRDEWGEMQIRADDLTAAIDLALFMGEKEKAVEILHIFAENFHSTWMDLLKSRQVWQLLKDKALAKAIGVNEEKIAAFSVDVYETFKERLEKGALRVFRDTSLKDLVKMCDENTIQNAVWEETDYDPEEPPKTILHKGATKEQIAELEKRLEHDLPDDYKEFLSLTNGIESYWNGFFGEPRLLGTDEIHILDATEHQNTWNEASVDIIYIPNLGIKINWATLDRVILINDGREDTQFIWLVEPEYGKKLGQSFFNAYSQVDEQTQKSVNKLLMHFHAGKAAAHAVEWQVVVWSPRDLDLTVYHSFREFFEYLVGDTAKEDVLDEEDGQGRLMHSHDIFAYQMR
ncbi:hypothetical protein GQ43DRAFT_470301 [Delitschia confertaspora ATCC 74209]|uniref:Knr4/Smi1-like domain-containing protein n=1 Tax=Delitschia confertaspora ATCC 74209 TaxID=1513339 RepID=A0A9P4JPM2_9PLEO|nr:hypothetical protein GQ43DRAFT_470301 [Delitschia confertaspora ATCC 74209]